MKRLFATLCALSLLLSLAACAKKVEDPAPETDPPVTTQDVSPTPDDHTEPPATPDDGAEPTPAPSDGETAYARGSVNGQTFTSTFLGIGCTLDDGWTFYSDEQILEMNNLMIDSIEDEDISELLASSRTIYDMYAIKDQGLTSINLVFENLGLVYGKLLDEESYVELSMDSLKPALESIGATDVEVTKASIDFAGASRHGLQVTAKISDIAFYETIVCIQQGDYMGVITLGSYYTNDCPDLAALFYAL